MMRVGIAGIGIAATGLEDWPSARQILQRPSTYQPDSALTINPPDLLPANERRRATPLIKQALSSAQQAIAHYQATDNLATVFASACGELMIDDFILQALQRPDRPVSPTHFHNSVHNAAAGYYSIAMGSHAASTSLSAYDASFAAGLLEAASQVVVENNHVLLIACDMPPPARLSSFCPLQSAFSCALLLTTDKDESSCAHIELEIINNPTASERDIRHCRFDFSRTNTTEVEPTIGRAASSGKLNLQRLKTMASCSKMDDPDLETLRASNPAAHSLPLLQQLASHTQATVTLPYLHDQCLKIKICPC